MQTIVFLIESLLIYSHVLAFVKRAVNQNRFVGSLVHRPGYIPASHTLFPG